MMTFWRFNVCAHAHTYTHTHRHIDTDSHTQTHTHKDTHTYDLVPKGVQMEGSGFWLSIKSVSNTLSCCCFVCAFIIGQCHSGNNMSSKSGAAGEIFILTAENGHAHGECFWCFYSRTWQIKTLPQSPICIKEISLYAVHITSFIITFWFWS